MSDRAQEHGGCQARRTKVDAAVLDPSRVEDLARALDQRGQVADLHTDIQLLVRVADLVRANAQALLTHHRDEESMTMHQSMSESQSHATLDRASTDSPTKDGR